MAEKHKQTFSDSTFRSQLVLVFDLCSHVLPLHAHPVLFGVIRCVFFETISAKVAVAVEAIIVFNACVGNPITEVAAGRKYSILVVSEKIVSN